MPNVNFMAPAATDLADVQRRMMLAQMLMQAQKPEREPTRIVPRESWISHAAPAIQNIAGNYMMKNAQRDQQAMSQKALADLLAGGDGSQPERYEDFLVRASQAKSQGVDPELINALVQSRSPGSIERVDLGDSIGLMQRGQLIGRLPKGATPDAKLGAQTTVRGQDITLRGQDLTNAATLRGQDIGAVTAAAGRATTERGQDLTYQAAHERNTAAAAKGGKATAWNTYNTAVSQFKRDLGETWYLGPVWSKLPDVTEAQRTAEGSRANMAPVLKSVFREAGEGTFTDYDQELLLRMLPDRDDPPATRKTKFENIDAIVRAKLGVSGQGVTGGGMPAVGTVQDGYIFKGGNPADPNSWQKQ